MSTTSTISGRNSSNASFYKRHGRRASLLCHPHGLQMLKEYAKLKEKGLDETDLEFAERLATKLQGVVRERETAISSCLNGAIRDHWCQSHKDYSFVLGESAEAVDGVLSQSRTSGNPDCVVRMVPIPLFSETKSKLVQLIIEVSVDKNGGEKKIGQAFDYASLIKDKSNTALLFSFHIDRNKTESDSDGEIKLKITQEAFIYLNSEKEEERKMGFLWREVYDQREAKNEFDFLKSSCEGLVRCLECATHHREAPVICSNIEYPSQWEVMSDNVVICKAEDEHVLKIFDNRFHPTHRRPDEWLNKERTWIKRLGVETEFEFKESSTVDQLGRPATSDRKRAHDSDVPIFRSHTPYPKGSVVVIKYKHVRGTHFASRVSHFRDIASRISEMHEENTVHGDIRGFNMLHPYPPADNGEQKEGISESLLIDFDLSGTPDSDRYPPGYRESVVDNAFERSGVAGEKMQKVDDWKDLGSVMAHYSISLSLSGVNDLNDLKRQTRQTRHGNPFGIYSVKKATHVLCTISSRSMTILRSRSTVRYDCVWKRLQSEEPGSPNKQLQKPRGSLTVDQSSK
jgi:hypothetical protein